VLERSLAGLVVARVALVFENVGEVADGTNDGLPRSCELHAAKLRAVLNESGEIGLGSLEVRVTLRWNDRVGDLLVHILATTDELGVLDVDTLQIAFGTSGLRAIEDRLDACQYNRRG
jgi:hypothetical protein